MKKLVLATMMMVLVGLVGCNKQADDVSLTNAVFEESTPAEETEDIIEENVAFEETPVSSEEIEISEQPKVSNLDFSNIEVCFSETEDPSVPKDLTFVSEKGNEVSKVETWFVNEQLFLPMLGEPWRNMISVDESSSMVNPTISLYGNAFYDDNYIYDWTSSGLDIYDRNSEQLLYQIFYQMDQWYLMGNCAYLRDGILYIGYLYNGYAMPNTCYLMAYDIENEEVLWRSEDQTYNTMNFIVRDDVIICGYGFTGEKDYIYQIDMNTGKVIGKTELQNKPDLLVEKAGQLYVHTYSCDYVFDMGGE